MSLDRLEKFGSTRRFQRRARQESDKQALQARILDAAHKEFATSSLETVSIQKIANTLGYSKGTVLKYFPTKILLLLAVKERNLAEVNEKLERVRAQHANGEVRLRRVMETYVDYWVDNPDHFRTLYTMAGTVADRRFPDGAYFGQTEVARRGYGIFVTAIHEYLSELGVKSTPILVHRLATAVVAAAHGVISLPLGTPTMKWPNIRGSGRLVLGNLIDAWSAKINAARRTESWPKISISHFM